MSELATEPDTCAEAKEFERRSIARWGARRTTPLIGRHPAVREALKRAIRFAPSDSPVLVSGETGTGKELLARALYLFSQRSGNAFVAVNCAQYRGGQPVVSELFGHRKGSFTGADSDHKGILEAANGGVVLLDEIGELPMSAQAMLLRALGEGEVVPVGGVQRRPINVRIIAASNRELDSMVAAGDFREDLFYRLRSLHVKVPPLRERGQDYALIARHWLNRLNRRHQTRKRLAKETLERLGSHRWPGNVRELKNVIEYGYDISRADDIGLDDIGELLERATRRSQFREILNAQARDLCRRMKRGEGTFWDLIHAPYMNRSLNRSQVRTAIALELAGNARGSYKKMLLSFGVPEAEYLKAMDFLRHHDLKPRRSSGQDPAGRPADPWP